MGVAVGNMASKAAIGLHRCLCSLPCSSHSAAGGSPPPDCTTVPGAREASCRCGPAYCHRPHCTARPPMLLLLLVLLVVVVVLLGVVSCRPGTSSRRARSRRALQQQVWLGGWVGWVGNTGQGTCMRMHRAASKHLCVVAPASPVQPSSAFSWDGQKPFVAASSAHGGM
jgi:hypothetical protein